MLLAAVVAGVFVFTKSESRPPDRFTASVGMLVPVVSQDGPALPPGMPSILQRGQLAMALHPDTRLAALEQLDLESASRTVALSATASESGDVIRLIATTPNPDLSRSAATAYASAFTAARQNVHADAIEEQIKSIDDEVTRLEELNRDVERQLRERYGQIPPITPIEEDGSGDRPAIGDDIYTNQLIYQHRELDSQLKAAYEAQAGQTVNQIRPSSFATVIERNEPARIRGTVSSPTVPVAAIILGGLFLGIALAVLADRSDRTIRDSRMATATLAAPVLSTVPARADGDPSYALLDEPVTARGEAYRALAATSLATDRLPRSIMVSSPTGNAHDEVAANFAAALADLGLRVALVATSAAQRWFLEPFTPPERGATNIARLLADAHAGRLNGQVRYELPRAERLPNLVVVPPNLGGDSMAPLDGLPPLLEAMENADIDVTVIAGPALLEDPNATIVAWSTRSVLWAIPAGEIAHDAATAAANRLELAGVRTFGIAMVRGEA